VKSVTTSIRINAGLALRLARAASRMARGKNWIITQALEEYLARVNQEGLAAEARRQSLIVARRERRHRDDRFWQGDTAGWR